MLGPMRDSSSEPATSPVFGEPTFAASISETLLTGGRTLRGAFLKTPYRVARRHARLVTADDQASFALMVHRGFAYRSSTLTDGRRAIFDLLLPGDIYGIDQLVMGRSNHDVTVASEFGYRVLYLGDLQKLLADPAVAMRVLALQAEARWRLDRHAAAICRLEARERIASLLIDIHDRLRRRQLISSNSFNLPLTQDEIADYLGLTTVHVSRTLRRLREEKLVLVDRQVVIIMDPEGLRALVHGLPRVVGVETPAAAIPYHARAGE
jgi:CRP/FNR family transcriptional regulator, anaerobic regulatory protein